MTYRRMKEREKPGDFEYWGVFDEEGRLVFPAYSRAGAQSYIKSCKPKEASR